MLYGDVVKKVKDRSHRGDVDVTTDLATAQIVRAMNDARRKIIRRVPKEWLRSTSTIAVVQATTTYSLASDVQEPIIFRYTSSNTEYVLKKIDSEREFYQDYYSANASQDKPRVYIEISRSSGSRQIQVYPTPDASYTVNYAYYKDPTATELTTSDLATAVADIPSYLQEALVEGTLWMFLKCFDDHSAADRAEKDFKTSLLEADIAEDQDRDGELSFRFGRGEEMFTDPSTGIRLE